MHAATKSDHSDTELLNRARSGDMAAFERIVKRYEPRVAATVVGMLGQCQAADDVGQEVFIRLYKYMHNFNQEASLGTYLTRIAINLSLNELTRRKRRLRFFKSGDEDAKDIAFTPDEASYTNENQRLVHAALGKLAPEFRSVIVLRLLEGYSTIETANILSVPQGTVLSRLSRAQKKLKTILTPYIDEEKGTTAFSTYSIVRWMASLRTKNSSSSQQRWRLLQSCALSGTGYCRCVACCKLTPCIPLNRFSAPASCAACSSRRVMSTISGVL